MVEFVTLFLAMAWGPAEIEVAVDQRVAAVEILLDGEPAGRIEGEPWRLRMDFGEPLLPHALEAVAFDAKGRRLGRAHQWVNFARGLAEARWAVDPRERWPPKRARLVWNSIDGAPPRGVEIRFDQQDLEADDGGWVDLPAYDPRQTHNLAAELRFEVDRETRADLVFGGVFGESVVTELSTAVVQLPGELPPPSPEQASRWIDHAEEGPPKVTSVESGPAFVVLGKDRRLPRVLPVTAREQMSSDARRPKHLRRRDRLFFIRTSPDSSAFRPEVALFKPYQVGDPYRSRGVLYAARRLGPQQEPESPQRLLDALAVAGRVAARSARPRAVLWLRGADGPDGESQPDRSLVDLPRVKGYLEALHVPLVVWQAGGEGSVAEAVAELHASLGRQAVLWVEGGYLPQDFTFSEAAPEGLRFAGGPL